MREVIEFRIFESFAAQYLPDPSRGTRIGIARRVLVSRDDPLFAEIGAIDRRLQARGRAFFASWVARRSYSSKELASAMLLSVTARTVFEPAGEECGTGYDDAAACPLCGGGAPQITPLLLPYRRIPPRVDIASTIAGEVVVSARFLDVLERERLTGAALDAVMPTAVSGCGSRPYYQLSVRGTPVQLDAATKVGNDPFDDAEGGRCARGDTIGLNVLSELSVRAASYDGTDLVATKELIGPRRGLLRPRPVLLVSQRGWRAVQAAGLAGFRVEVASLR